MTDHHDLAGDHVSAPSPEQLTVGNGRDDTSHDRSGRKWKRATTSRLLRGLIVPVVIVGAWLGFSYGGIVDSIFLPSATDLWDSFQGLKNQLPESLLSSVTMTLAGFFIGTTLGIGSGLLLAYSKATRELFGGVLDFVRPVPVFALIPLFVLWFGIGKTPQITLIALGTSVILGVTTIEAVKNVPAVFVRAALTLGASRLTIYRTVILPCIFPHLLGAIRVAAAASWGLDVAAEFIGAQTGLGYLMIVRQQYLDTAGIVDVVIIYSILAIGFDYLIRIASAPLIRWTDRGTRQGAAASIVGAT